MNQPHRSSTSWTVTPTSVNCYRSSSNPNASAHPDSQTLAQAVQPIGTPSPPAGIKLSKRRRRRGLILTEQGWQKLQQAGVLADEFGDRYTFEQISEITLLNSRTISKVLGRETGVDKRTLKTFFSAFNLQLEKSHYTTAGSNADRTASTLANQQPDIATQAFGSSSRTEELAQLKQQILEDCCRLVAFLGLDQVGQITLSVKLTPQAPPQLDLGI